MALDVLLEALLHQLVTLSLLIHVVVHESLHGQSFCQVKGERKDED